MHLVTAAATSPAAAAVPLNWNLGYIQYRWWYKEGSRSAPPPPSTDMDTTTIQYQ
jgi:hypothetical protein